MPLNGWTQPTHPVHDDDPTSPWGWPSLYMRLTQPLHEPDLPLPRGWLTFPMMLPPTPWWWPNHFLMMIHPLFYADPPSLRSWPTLSMLLSQSSMKLDSPPSLSLTPPPPNEANPPLNEAGPSRREQVMSHVLWSLTRPHIFRYLQKYRKTIFDLV